MRVKGLASCVALCALLQACSFGPDVELALTVDSADPAVVEETQRVLSARFAAFRPSLLSRAELVVAGSTLRYSFKNGAPDPAVLEYLYRTPGRLTASLVTEPPEEPWFTERDIRHANVVHNGSARVVRIDLTPEAGRRLLGLTLDHVGRELEVTLDGATLMRARINGVFSVRFEITGADVAPALGAILENGALPASVAAVPVEGI
jgi:preprotein translocase subunit SecD